KDFLPLGWEIIAQPSGDLNGDKILDYALVLEDNDPSRWKTDDEQAEEPYMYASRILAILFGGTRGGYSLAEQSNTFIMERCDPYMEEPFTGIEISNEGDLQISFNLFYTAGSWYTTSGSYTFRYINKEFTLVSVKRFDYKRNTGESWDYSYDFLAMTRTMVEESPEESEEDPDVIEETIELDEPITLKSLEAPFSLQIGDWDPI
ncbi:MAG TPA: hypothetical protein VHY08_07420, partial [Bacillota bacterium]|nr:hypothetical protein [Bacillota bacterium]